MSIQDQTPPKPSEHPAVWDLVIDDMTSDNVFANEQTLVTVRNDMHERDRIGEERYGTRLQSHNGRDALVDAYQEALDMAVYLRQAVAEHKVDPVLSWDVYRDALATVIRIRKLLDVSAST